VRSVYGGWALHTTIVPGLEPTRKVKVDVRIRWLATAARASMSKLVPTTNERKLSEDSSFPRHTRGDPASNVTSTPPVDHKRLVQAHNRLAEGG
jgi:hypothetical protein